MSFFVDRHGAWDDEARRRATHIDERLSSKAISRLRFAWSDQHGLVRGKTLLGDRARHALRDGVGFVGTNLLKDTSDRTAWPVFDGVGATPLGAFANASDMLLVADPTTYVELPWSPGTGWVLCEAWHPHGQVCELDTRALLRRELARAAGQGYRYRVGLEVECHLFKLVDQALQPADSAWPAPAPAVTLLTPGYRLLSEQRYDQIEPVLELLREPLQAMGLPLESIEIELGPSQVEFVFAPREALAAADAMLLFRHAAKQILRRHGYLVSFMCRPALPNLMASGWHLHQSLEDLHGTNLFVPDPREGPARGDAGDWLSPLGTAFLGGLLAHGRPACAFAAPTINGYRRFKPNALAPQRITWGRDNRGAMLRVVGEARAGSSRIENRVGEPAANPYLYLASQLAAGLAGGEAGLDPGPGADAPYAPDKPLLPSSLGEAIEALAASALFADRWGQTFMDYYVHLKRAELARFGLEVTEWEQREYFDMF